MELQTPYQLRIPRDAIATIASDGILGPAYLAIDASRASAPAIQNGGRLPSKEAERVTAGTVDRMLKEMVKQLSDEQRKGEVHQNDRSSPSGPPPSQPARPK
jgi:ABC-type transporter Mla subunit MlaD